MPKRVRFAGLALAAAATLTGCSSGPERDTAFEDALTEQGVAGRAVFGDRLDDAGQAVCADLRAGFTVEQLAGQGDALDPEDRVPFVETAARTFCPEVTS